MTSSREPEIPIACPACKGKGVGLDGDPCWSCYGSCILLISKSAYAMLMGFRGKMERHRFYTDAEKKIIMGPGKRRERLELLHEKGYKDRTYEAIGIQFKKWRAEAREKAGA